MGCATRTGIISTSTSSSQVGNTKQGDAVALRLDPYTHTSPQAVARLLRSRHPLLPRLSCHAHASRPAATCSPASPIPTCSAPPPFAEGYELYDLNADPHEVDNIFDRAPRSLIAALQGQLSLLKVRAFGRLWRRTASPPGQLAKRAVWEEQRQRPGRLRASLSCPPGGP